ncbi:hypothetical protein N0V88_004325 [Collariella sp. IMI 366227]|nr:hypothetical protein N0V88_004325 [Collariella sp. IMI 366227]
MDGTGWNTYGPVPTNGLWDHSVTGSPNLNPYGTVWAASPSETLSTNTWSPSDQPLPSPMSEAPSYVSAQTSSTPKPHPRTLKRHRSDTPSITSSTHTNNTSTTISSSTTTLGGILPANVDPRVASEQIRREAWERCRAEAHEMLQRRMQLVDHERGALEREAQRLQENLGRAARRDRDAAKRAGR